MTTYTVCYKQVFQASVLAESEADAYQKAMDEDMEDVEDREEPIEILSIVPA